MFGLTELKAMTLFVSLLLCSACTPLPGQAVTHKRQLNGHELELAIQLKQPTEDYLREHVCFLSRGGKPFMRYQVIAIEETKDRIMEYVWFEFSEYLAVNDRLESGSGGSFPVALSVTHEKNGYKVIESKQSIAGELDMIPEALRPNIPAYHEEASRWFKVIRDEAEAYFRSRD